MPETGHHTRHGALAHEERALVKGLIQHLREGVVVVEKGVVVALNTVASALLGDAGEGVSLTDLFHREDQARAARLTGTGDMMQPVQLRTARGERVRLRPVSLGNAGSTSLIMVLLEAIPSRPMSETALQREKAEHERTQSELRQTKSFSRYLVDHSPDMIMAADTQGRITEFNPAAVERFGYRPEEVLGGGTAMLYADPLEMERVFHEMRTKGVFIGEIRNITKEGEVFTAFLSATELHDENGTYIGAMGVSRDVSRERQAGEKLREQEAKMRALFESSEHMFWTIGPGVVLTSHNRAYTRMIDRLYGVRPEINKEAGFRRQRFASSTYHDFWEEKYASAFGGEQVRFETDIHDRNGARVCNEIFLSPVFGKDGHVKEVFGVGHEITEQKEAQDLVRAQGARLRAIFESSANMMFWTLDRAFCITSFNEHFQISIAQAHGVRFRVGDPFIEQMSKRVARGEHAPIVARYREALKGVPQQFEVELVDQQGDSIWVENFLNPIMIDGRVTELSCLAYGITDRKHAQRALVQSLHEKEVLLKEVHHRVKNNLQIVSSIFNLQSAHAGNDKRVLDLLRDSRDRIRSMAFIHESLYQHKEFSSVDLARYIDGLSRNLMLSYSLTGKIDLRTDLQEVHLVLDQAIPCGLILNELISNALKHAFPGGSVGTVTISLHHVGDRVSIGVSDDGVGLPAGFDPQRHGNLGLELVHTLAEQLDGQVRMTGGPGASYLLTFERTKN